MKASKDHEESPLTIHNREIWMDFRSSWKPTGGPGLPKRAVKRYRGASASIFIGNLNHEATEEDVLEVLKPLGNVVSVRIGALFCESGQVNHVLNLIFIATSQDKTSRGFAHVDFETAGEAEKVLKHYGHHSIHILNQKVRLDRASPPAKAYPPSLQLHFTGWEGDESSLRSHFRALGSKIVNVLLCRSTSVAVRPSSGLQTYTVESHDPNVTTRSGFVKFCDMGTAAEALARFDSPELVLNYARPVGGPKPSPENPVRRRRLAGYGYGLKRQQERSDADK
jgi:hypothetical protein